MTVYYTEYRAYQIYSNTWVRGGILSGSNIPPMACQSGLRLHWSVLRESHRWTFVGGNNYAQWNMRVRGSNSRPPGLDTKLEGPPD
jgi:hypothetical protein